MGGLFFFFMAFTLDRTEAAKRLGVSTRTIDRHIQSNRIRTRRIGKKMFLEEDDVELIRSEDPTRRDDYVVILNEEPKEMPEITMPPSLSVQQEAQLAIAEFSRIYTDAQGLIARKDEVIQDLSYKLGKAETELQNSVDASEYRRTAHLLETAKSKNDEDSRVLGEKISLLEKEVQKRNSFIIGLVILFVVVITSSFVFFFYNRFL